jgi:xanthine dehydrogenase accessory factor
VANTDLARLRACVGTEPVLLVSVGQQQGSVPREQGAWMGVTVTTVIGTVGGGHLEWEAIAHARALLSDPPQGPTKRHFKLGPSLGQCCGGALDLEFVYLPSDLPAASAQSLFQRLKPPSHPVVLFGGGHVGQAIERALRPLPFDLMWVDSRDEIFPSDIEPSVITENMSPVQDAVVDIKPGAFVLIMSFSHAEDLDVLLACLMRQRRQGDLRFIGLIGSATKWASFSNRARERGFTDAELAQVTCPIGLPSISGKEPAVIAASVVAQLLGFLRG